MPTYDFRATSAPQDLVAAMGLSPGQYMLQNVDRSSDLWLRESLNAPAAGELGIRLAPNESLVVIVGAEPVWAWSFDNPGGCALVVNG